jgi:NADPH:quinone reductase-like Zn-dependent oxidoreductase
VARAIRFHETGGPEVLRIDQVDVPAPGVGEVQIRVKAIGLNRAEASIRAGRYIESPAHFPSGLGLEAAGIVEQVGEGVEDLARGDAVSVIPQISMLRWPTYADRANFPAAQIVRHPPSLGWQKAAATWMQYLTAYGALIDVAKATGGDRIVITAASSSVGLAAIQIARRIGATPIAVTRTSDKKPALIRHGATHVIASQEEDLEARLREITSEGVRIVFDPVGGPAFRPLTAAMARGGILIEYGGLSSEPTPFPLYDVLAKGLTLRGFLVHEIIGDPDRLEAAKAFILEGLHSGSLQPIIARTFPFDQIVDAHHYLESNRQFGKIVVTL